MQTLRQKSEKIKVNEEKAKSGYRRNGSPSVARPVRIVRLFTRKLPVYIVNVQDRIIKEAFSHSGMSDPGVICPKRGTGETRVLHLYCSRTVRNQDISMQDRTKACSLTVGDVSQQYAALPWNLTTPIFSMDIR